MKLPILPPPLDEWPEDLRYLFFERVAIRHFDGGQELEAAKVAALAETRGEAMKQATTIQRVGFTGTRNGMTEIQHDAIRACLAFAFIPGAEFHHGGCEGADEEAAYSAVSLGYRVIAHPGPYGTVSKYSDVVMPRKPFMDRNQDIVSIATELYAAPVEIAGQLRSGTWETIRRARRRGVFTYIVAANGEGRQA